MASDLRKSWQDFKKKHPDFEKHKNFKSDVGPQIDKFSDACMAVIELYRELKDDKLKVVFKQGASIDAALKGYEQIVKQLKSKDKTIEADFRALGFEDFDKIWLGGYRVLLGSEKPPRIV